MASVLISAVGFYWIHATFLSGDWQYYGFTFQPLGPVRAGFGFTAIIIAAFAVPKTLDRPSSLILVILLAVVYIPTVVVTISLGEKSIEAYGLVLFGLVVGFVLACVQPRLNQDKGPAALATPGRRFQRLITVAWFLSAVILIFEYRSIMKIVGIKDIYDQRAVVTTSGRPLIGYVHSYFSIVLCPCLMAIGLSQRRFLPILLGVAGCALSYSINAQKVIFILPLALLGMASVMNSKFSWMRSTSVILSVLCFLSVSAVAYRNSSALAEFVTALLVLRTQAIPGLAYSIYSDLFGSEGYTYWSHVRGIGLLVAKPRTFESDPSWPNLGAIIGQRMFGSTDHNFNANLFAGDGVAAAGAVGVILIGALFGFWLLLIDRASRGWDRAYLAMIFLPIALMLTNGHFFTTLLSYGGMFWLLVLYFGNRSNRLG